MSAAYPPARRRSAAALRPLGLCAALALVALGCSGEDAAPTEVAIPVAGTEALPAALVSAAWPSRLAVDAARAPFEAHPGWGMLFQRKNDEALAAFAAEPMQAIPLARLHADQAALYRQAALLGANATRHVYGTDRLAEDPPQVDYLLAEALLLTGDCGGAAATLSRLTGASELTERAAALAAVAGLPACTADLAPLTQAPFPTVSEPPSPGLNPSLSTDPAYTFADLGGGPPTTGAELAALVALSRWHEAAARAAAGPEGQAAIDQLLAPWTLPGEPVSAPAAAAALDDAWLFGGFAMSPADLAFVAAARVEGLAAVSAWRDRSLYAAALGPAVVEGAVVPELVLDQAALLGRSLRAAQEQAGGGGQGFHRTFGDLGVVGFLRAAVVVAEAAGQSRDAGILRVNVFERSEGAAGDPVFLLSLAAWDAGNRSPLRAQEIVHNQLPRFPSIAVARYPLDALHLRLGRTAAPSNPVH